MNPIELIVLVVLVAVVGGVLRERYRAHGIARFSGDPEADGLRDEVRRLRERVQVLERVITDQHGPAGLDAEIERLRDR